MGLEHEYRRLSLTEDSTDQPDDKPVPTRLLREKRSWLHSRTAGTVLAAVAIAVVAGLATTLIFHHPATPTTEPAEAAKPVVEVTTCGNSADEARALGCVYDVMMQLWTPPECFDSVLTEKYLATNNWTWYADFNAERIMSDEEIALGNHNVVYVAQDYHVKHCIFAWEKVVRALRNQEPLIEELISYDHVLHCRDHTLLPALDPTKHIRGVVAPTGFTRCAPFDTWIKALPENEHSSTD